MSGARGSIRRAVLAVSAVLSAAGFGWAAYLTVAGGVDVRILGHAVSSNEPLRPLLVAAAMLVAYLLAGGDESFVRRIDRVAAAFQTFRWFDVTAIAALVALVGIAGITRGSKIADGSDSFGYVSEADLFLAGKLAISQPWAREVPWPNGPESFIPLAYRPGPVTASFSLWGYPRAFDPTAIVPTYSPGLPMLMAAAKRIGGQCALLAVVPLTGAVLVLATYGLGCRLGSRRLGLVAAFLIATTPTVLRLELSSMSDVPVAAAWAVAWWGALGRTWRSAAAGACALAMTVLIRPNLVPIAVLVPLWTWWCVIRDRQNRPRLAARAAVVTAGLVAGGLATAAVYWLAYGSPTVSGYGDVSTLFGVSNILPNLRNYSVWFGHESALFGYAGVAALFVPARTLWPGVADRRLIWMFAATLVLLLAQYSYFSVFDNASYLRFFLPAYPLIMLGLASVALTFARRGRLTAVAVTSFLVVYSLVGVKEVSEIFDTPKYEAPLLELYDRVHSVTSASSVILAMQHSGGTRYHSGRVTLRWDYLRADGLDRAVAWMSDRGVRTYALIDDWELQIIRQRFAGQVLAAAFERPAALATSNTLFYDLSGPLIDRTEHLTGAAVHRCRPAFPVPAITWQTR
jgi:hypothetical protein